MRTEFDIDGKKAVLVETDVLYNGNRIGKIANVLKTYVETPNITLSDAFERATKPIGNKA